MYNRQSDCAEAAISKVFINHECIIAIECRNSLCQGRVYIQYLILFTIRLISGHILLLSMFGLQEAGKLTVCCFISSFF